MTKTIKLTIQEIVLDYEQMIRCEEHITTLEDIDQLSDDDLKDFKNDMQKMIEKYIPNYKRFVPVTYFSDETSDKNKAVILSDMLQENFKEIFYQLV